MSNSKNKTKFSFISFCASIAILLLCSFGLSACTWFTDDTPAGDSSYDANGNLRLNAVNVFLNKPQADGSVDSNTGSFEWELEYYIDAPSAVPHFDQKLYNQEFYDSTQFAQNSSAKLAYLYAGYTYKTSTDIPYSVDESGYYKIDEQENIVHTTRTHAIMSASAKQNIKFLVAGQTYTKDNINYSVDTTGYYVVENIGGTIYKARVYSKLTDGQIKLLDHYGSNLSTDSYNGYYIRYPSYTVSISGLAYQIKVDVLYDNLIFDFNEKQMFKLADGATLEETFKFFYRVGTTGDWINCSEDDTYDIAKPIVKDGRFFVQFNPILGKGSTSRYVRVQTNTNPAFEVLNRGSSVFTSPVNFNVYKMTFTASCNNSTVETYEALNYDIDSFYFSNTTLSTNRGTLDQTYYTSITGYFVEGKIVNVDRYSNKNGDYALQSWTVNGKADNTVVIQETLPTKIDPGFDNITNGTLTCLNNYSTSIAGIKLVNHHNNLAEISLDTKDILYGEYIRTVNEHSKQYSVGTIHAVSCASTASNVFYANTAKVKNFILSGTLYDGDKFFSAGGNATLADVDIYFWWKDSIIARFIPRDGQLVFDNDFAVSNSEIYNDYLDLYGITPEQFRAGCEYENSQFVIKNLSYDSYISFGKTINDDVAGTTTYSFYSASMTQVNWNGTSFYCLGTEKAKYIYSDRAGNAIIGTALDAASKIEVNIYVTDDAGNNLENLEDLKTSANGIQYQIISTTTSKTDVYGYTTSSVIISLLLPSNSSLTAYNLESINSISTSVYSSVSDTEGYILSSIDYDESTRNVEYRFFYVVPEIIENRDSVSHGQTLNCLYYNDQFYQYSHKDTTVEGTDTYNNYYYAYDVVDPETSEIIERYVIKHSVNTDPRSGHEYYTHLTYTAVEKNAKNETNPNKLTIKNDATDETTGADSNQIQVTYVIEYKGNSYVFSMQNSSSDVDVIATAYKTQLTYTATGSETSQDMYVYYDIKTYNYKVGGSNVTEYYYLTPIGKRTQKIESTEIGTSISNEFVDVWFFDELNNNSNLAELLYNSSTNEDGIVMLGLDILTLKDELSSNFYHVTDNGVSLIADHYYYIAPLAAPVDLLISQYINTDATTIVETNDAYFKYAVDTDGQYLYDSTNDRYYFDTNSSLTHYKMTMETVEDEDGDEVQRPVYTEGTGSEYIYILVEGSYVADTNLSLTHYSREVYTNQIKAIPQEYLFQIGSLFLDSNIVTQNVYLDYEAKVDDNSIYSINGNTYYSSMNNPTGKHYLYSIEKGTAISYVIADATNVNNSTDFIDQERYHTLLQNASVATATISSDTYYYLSERQYYNHSVTKISSSPEAKSFTNEYKFYSYSPSSDLLFSTSLYINGTDVYMAAGSQIQVTIDGKIVNRDVLIKLDYNSSTKTYSKELTISKNDTDITFEVSFISYNEGTGKFSLVQQYFSAINGDESKGLTFQNVLIRKYYENHSEVTDNIDSKVALGKEWVVSVGDIQTIAGGDQAFTPAYYLTNAAVINTGISYYYYESANPTSRLYKESVSITREATLNNVVRSAVLYTNTSAHVHLLGKIVLLSDGQIEIYPSYNYYLSNESTTILGRDETGLNYYTIDYTTVNSVIQAFPGVKLLSGAPYANPILFFEVKHKADERAVVEIGLEVKNAYYVEIISNALTSTTQTMIYDFSTVTFKDTITQLTQNDYIDRMYYVLDKETQTTIIAYYQNDDGEWVEYLAGTPLTIQNIGLNDDDPNVYSILKIDENSRYLTQLFYAVENAAGDLEYFPLNVEDLIIWESTSSYIEDLPTFDIHNYYVSDNGLVILTSNGNEHALCEKVEDLFISGTGSTTSDYDYSEVLIGGFTSAYRVSADALEDVNASRNLQSYWWEDAINITNCYNEGDAYFLTGTEGVVLVANPIVQLSTNDNENIIYRFKHWLIYSRYNSEVLYYNKALSDAHADKNNAVMRFTSSEAGYFVFMPVYERVYTVNLGSSVYDGAPNLGGSVSVLYNGTSVDMSKAQYGEDALDIYFVELHKTVINNEEQYYYNNLQITPVLYYNGTNFESVEHLFSLPYGRSNKRIYFRIESGNIKYLQTLTELEDQPGVVVLEAKNGMYTFSLGDTQYSVRHDQAITELSTEPIVELLSFTYNVNHYSDGIAEVNENTVVQSKFVVYDDDTMSMYALTTEELFNVINNGYTGEDDLFEAGEFFATTLIKNFNCLATASDPYSEVDYDSLPTDFEEGVSSFKYSNLAYLASGELYSYEDPDTGAEIINTTQQFKSSYFERDSRLIITAMPDMGYRLKDWYLAEYVESTQSWIISETALSDTINSTYRDLIRPAYYNEPLKLWYYVTEYYETKVDGSKIYYYNEEKTAEQQSVVADAALDLIRGYYAPARDAYGTTYYIPVYRKDMNSGVWYTDPAFSSQYTGEVSAIIEKAHYDCIREWHDNTVSRYLIGNFEVYKHDGQYYRTKDIGNMYFKDNTIYIYNLHSNIRIVAEFIEVYQAFIFAEDSREDNIEVVSVYYDGLRSNAGGENMEEDDKPTNKMEISDFYDQYETTQSITYNNYVGYSAFTNLTSNNHNFRKVTEKDEHEANVYNETQLNLVTMYFDVYTTMYVVVRVYYDKTLNIHTLGMNSNYNLVPVFYPTDDFIKENTADGTYEHYYYIFKVTFDRDLDFYSTQDIDGEEVRGTLTSISGSNYNPEYLVHVNRGNSLAGDVFAGNYSSYYGKLFTLYDHEGNEIFYDINPATKKITLKASYKALVRTYLTAAGIDLTGNETFNTLLSASYSSLKEFFNVIKEEYNFLLSVSAVADKNEYVYPKTTPLTDKSGVMSVINHYFTNVCGRITGPQNSGSTNFINLSSIPVYTYTTRVKVLDNVTEPTSYFSDVDLGVALKQKLFTRGGYQGYTYIGAGVETTAATSIEINHTRNVYPQYYSGNTTAGAANYLDLFAEDYALAQDTIMVLDGVEGDIKENNGVYYVEYIDDAGTENTTDDRTIIYIFSGWYEQKAVTNDEGEKVWGEFQLMSTQIERPFMSVAYADTNIIALFERAVTLELQGPNNSFTVNFNSLKDDLNNNIQTTYEVDGSNVQTGTFTVSGIFKISSLFNLAITPSGGYRFGSTWTIINDLSITDSINLKTTSIVDFSQEDNENYAFINMNLVKTVNFEFTFGHVIALVDTLQKSQTITINLNMTPVQLTYIRIEGYTKTEDGVEKLSGYEFNVYSKDSGSYSKIVETQYYDGNVFNAIPGATDSAQRPIQIHLEDGNLNIYGYFDFYQYNNNLFIEYVSQPSTIATIKAWYINTHSEHSSELTYGGDPYPIANTTFSYDGGTVEAFKLSYLYAYNEAAGTTNLDLTLPDGVTSLDPTTIQSIIAYYNNDLFNLSEDNYAYLLTAKIEAKSTLDVSYATIDNINAVNGTIELGSTATLIEKADQGSISWVGAKFESLESDEIVANGIESFVDANIYDTDGITVLGTEPCTTSYYFYSGTSVTLNNSMTMYESAGTYYKFIGWFAYDPITQKMQIRSNTSSLSTKGSGSYVAIFAKVVLIDEIYTIYEETKNENAQIEVLSNYKIATSVTAVIDGAVATTKSFDIPVFGVNDDFATKFTYVVVGSTIDVKVVADNGYLVKDILYSYDSAAEPVGLLDISKSNSTKAEITIDNFGEENSNDKYTIYAEISRGYSIRVVQVYYDSIAMNNIGLVYDSQKFTTVSLVGNPDFGGLIADHTYTLAYGMTLNLTFAGAQNFDLIDYYVNGTKLDLLSPTTKLAEYVVEDNVTIEVRLTKYVYVSTAAYYVGTSNEISFTDTIISYVDHYTGETKTFTGSTMIDEVKVLSGTKVNFNTTSTNATATLINWKADTLFNEYVTEFDVSSTPEFEYVLEYKGGESFTLNYNYYYTFTAYYESVFKVSINKIIASHQPQDAEYYDEATETWDPAFLSLLDVAVDYVDADGKNQTIILGSLDSIEIKVKQGSKITVTTKISEALANRYGSSITINGSSLTTKTIDSTTTVNTTFYAKRNLTLVRQVNNQPYAPMAVTPLTLAYRLGGDGGTTVSLNASYSQQVFTGIASNENLSILAGKSSEYTFGGFFVNGVAVGTALNESARHNLSIKPVDDVHAEGTFENNTYYTNETDLTVVALWYNTATIFATVTLDGENLFGVDATDAQIEMQDNLFVRLYGNKLTELEGQNIHNSALQSVQARNEELTYLANINLALIANHYAGYQFIGFYYKSDADENWTKLDFQNKASEYIYGDTLTSVLEGNKIVAGKTYYIEARYLTAWQILTQTTVLNSANAKGTTELKNAAMEWVQLETDLQYVYDYKDTFAGLTSNNKYVEYFYPTYGTLIGVHFDSGVDSNLTFFGYYINGVKVEPTTTPIEDGGFVYQIFDLSDLLSETDGIFDHSNLVIEKRYIKNVDLVVRIGIDNTGDITYINRDALNNLKITISSKHQYNATLDTTTEYTNNSANSYWNTSNNSLYIKLTLPVGSLVEVSITDINLTNAIIKDTNKTYKLNGWYLYTNHSVASSTSVINYTDNVEFTITDNTDIVSQFYTIKDTRTTDTAYSYLFYGENFATALFNPSTIGSETNNSDLAKQITAYLKTLDFDSTSFTKTFETTQSDGLEQITISTENGIIFDIDHNHDRVVNKSCKFMFLGWYQEIKDSKNPSTFLYVTNNLGLKYDGAMPHQMAHATNLIAKFAQIVTVKIGFAEGEEINTINYENLIHNMTSVAPLYFLGNADANEIIEEYFSTNLSDKGELTIKTLYNSDIKFKYFTIYGYHYNAISESPKTKLEFNTDNTDNPKMVENVDSNITYLYENGKIVKNVYKYQISTINNTVVKLIAQENCTEDCHSSAPASIASYYASEARVASFTNTATTFTAAATLDEDFEIVEDASDIKAYISAQIDSPKAEETGVEFIVEVRYPNGTIETFTLNYENLFKFLSADPEGLTHATLPLGTTIYISISTDTRSEVLEYVRLYTVSETDFENVDADLSSYEFIQFDLSNTISFAITDDVNGYLRVVAKYKNIYSIELTDNDVEQGIVNIDSLDDAATNLTEYSVVLSTQENYAFEDLKIEFAYAETTVSTTLKTLFAGFNNEATNFTDIILSLTDEQTLTVDKWTIVSDSQTATISYVDGSKTYLTIRIEFVYYSEVDSLRYTYLTGFRTVSGDSSFDLGADIRISPTYAHITKVNTTYTVEKFDANSETYTSSETSIETNTLYIFDYQFYTADADDSYLVVNKLNELYSTIDTTNLSFVGYTYSGNYISLTVEATPILVIYDATVECNDLIYIEAVYIASITGSVKLDIDYYNSELDDIYEDTESLLGTPITNIKLYTNGTSPQGFDSVEDSITINSQLNEPTSVTILDTENYFSFVEWTVKYNNKYLAIQDISTVNGTTTTTYQKYSIKSSSLNISAELYINLIEILKNSEEYSFAADSDFAQYDGSDININNFELCAVLKEEVVEISVEYTYDDEEFDVKFEAGGITEQITAQKDSTNYAKAFNSSTFLVKNIDIEADEDLGIVQDRRLVIVYSKHTAQSNTVKIHVYANQYQKPESSYLAKYVGSASDAAIRQIFNAEDTKNYYSSAKYLLLKGFTDLLGNVYIKSQDYLANSFEFTISGSHTTTYTLTTQNLYLIELGAAVDHVTTPTDSYKFNMVVNGTSYEHEGYNLVVNPGDTSSIYAAISFLVDEGATINLSVNNQGAFTYTDPANGTSFRGFAVSNTKSVSDIYKFFIETAESEGLSLYDFEVNEVGKLFENSGGILAWRKALNMSETDLTDFENAYYKTLNQYSDYNIPRSATTYAFIANENFSVISDYIGIFEDQKRYISVVLNSDTSIKYENNSIGDTSYEGENFVITIATSQTEIVLNKVVDEYTYSLLPNLTIVNTSNPLKKHDVDATFENDETLEETDNTAKLSFVQQSCQVAIGLVSDKFVTLSISAVNKYITSNETILEALRTTTEGVLQYGYQQINNFDGLYVINNENLESGQTVGEYIADLKANPPENPVDSLTIQKGKSVTFVAEERTGYTFAGFMIVSQSGSFAVQVEEQNAISNSAIFIPKQAVNHDYYNTDKYYAIQYNSIDGNATVIAVFEPKIYLINVVKKTYDEADVSKGSTFRPNPIADESTTQGKVIADSMVVAANETVELKVITNGFAEYKGVAIYSGDSVINSLYSTKSPIRNIVQTDDPTADTDSFELVRDLFTIGGYPEGTEFDSETDGLTYYDNHSEDISDEVTRGKITASKLFTDDYSKNTDGEFVQNLSSLSYLYLLLGDIDSDITLYAYFNAIYYTLSLDIGEIENGYTDENQYLGDATTQTDKVLGFDPYIAYSEAVRSQAGWTNPSANVAYGIAYNDPYIYTWIDNTGKALSYPVKLTLAMVGGDNNVTQKGDHSTLTLAQPYNAYGTNEPKLVDTSDADGIQSVALTTEIGDKTYDTVDPVYKNTIIENMYYYVEKTTTKTASSYISNYRLAKDLFTIEINGTKVNSGDLMTSEDNVTYDRYLNQIVVNNIPVSSLATLKITINYNSASGEPTIRISAKVFADKNSGFPAVSIMRVSNALIADGSISMNNIYFFDEEGNPEIKAGSSTGVSESFFSDAFIANEETGYLTINPKYNGNLQKNGLISYHKAAKLTEAKLTFENLNSSSAEVSVNITDPNTSTRYDGETYNTQTALLKQISDDYHGVKYTQCNEHDQKLHCNIGDHLDGNVGHMVDEFSFFIIHNAHIYIQALEFAGDEGIYQKWQIVDIITEIVSFNPYLESIDGYPLSGDIFDYINIPRSLFANIMRNCQYQELANRLEDPNCQDLRFTRLDLYSNFKNNVNKNFFGNSLSLGDLLVTGCKMTEHQAPHHVSYAAFGEVWKEDKVGYKYLNNAKTDFGSTVMTDAYYSHYNNDYITETNTFSTSVPISTAQSVVNWWAGITNRQAKYAGTYTRSVHAGLLPDSAEFTSAGTTFLSEIEIDLSQDARIRTENLNPVHGSWVVVIVEGIASVALIAAGIVLIVVTEGAAAAVLGGIIATCGTAVLGVAIYDGVQLIKGVNSAELTPLHTYINNLDFGFRD